MNVLSIDFGTSSCRAHLLDESGEVKASARVPVRVGGLEASFSEISAEEAWRTLVEAVGQLRARLGEFRPDIMGISSMLGWVFLDAKLKPLGPAVLWNDTRSGPLIRRIEEEFPEGAYREKTGRRISPELLAAHLQYMRLHRRSLFTRTKKILSLKDELVRRCTGELGMDEGHADYTGIYHLGKRTADEELCAFFGVSPAILPPVENAFSRAGYLKKSAAGQLGIPDGIPLVRGSIDGTTGMYGGGVLEEKSAVLVSGTSDVFMTYSENRRLDTSKVLTINAAMGKKGYLVGGATGMAGGAADQLKELLGEDMHSLSEEIGNIPPGAEGLLFSPGFSGERAPYWRDYARGTLLGLSRHHRNAHIYRAMMEGSSFRLLRIFLTLKEEGIEVDSVHQLGGGGRVDVWNRIRSNVLGLPLFPMQRLEATTLGTFLFCMSYFEGAELLSEVSSRFNSPAGEFDPDADVSKSYYELFELYERMGERTNDILQDLVKYRN